MTRALKSFKRRFNLKRYNPVASYRMLWVQQFRPTGSALKPKPSGKSRNARTPDNVKRVKVSFMQSTFRLACKHTSYWDFQSPLSDEF